MIFAAIIIHNDVSFPTIPFHLAPIDSQDSLELSELIFPTSRSPFSAVVNNPFFPFAQYVAFLSLRHVLSVWVCAKWIN